MKNNKGNWIKIHRKFLDWEWWGNPEMIKIFLYLLLNANFKDNNWQGILIKRGQLPTGYLSMAKNLNFSYQKCRTLISRLKSTGEITVKLTPKFSVITIVKYEEYQDSEKKSTVNSTVNSTAEQQPSNSTIRNKENNNISATASPVAEVADFKLFDWLSGLLAGSRKDLKIVAWFIHRKEMKLDSKEKAEAVLRRNLRPAGELTCWSSVDLDACADWLDDNGLSWTLETVVKHIAERQGYVSEDKAWDLGVSL